MTMKIAILTCGMLPLPAVQGGAVENLIDFYLDYNNRMKLHNITVYSPWNPKVTQHPALTSKVNHYHYIDVTSLKARIARRVYGYFHSHEYYNYFIEYYFEKVFASLNKKDYDYILLENCPGYAYKFFQRGYRNLILHLHNELLHSKSRHHDEIFNSLKLGVCRNDNSGGFTVNDTDWGKSVKRQIIGNAEQRQSDQVNRSRSKGVAVVVCCKDVI